MESQAQVLTTTSYDIGSPSVSDLWVDPTNGNDANSGATRGSAVRTLTEAWNRIPHTTSPLTSGYRIMLVAGDYPESSIPNYFENSIGTAEFPVIIQSADGRGAARLRGDINAFNISYLYLIDFDIVPDPVGDALHCERCDHLLMRGMELSGGAGRGAHETVKINQSQHIYIEDCDIWGSDENAIDFVAVQYGHILRNKLHDADDWCIYLKGGSAYFLVEANEIYNCGTGGFVAGQGTGLEYMTSPWLHFENYDTKFINNVIHDTEGAGMGVNGGYNVLLAHNTLYRVGSRSHTIEVVFGLRSCDGETAACAANSALGAWGPTTTGVDVPIGNRNVYIYNNVIYNPSGFQSAYNHFAIYAPRTVPVGSSGPSPATSDVNLKIRGNVIWNGNNTMPLGIEGDSEGCTTANTSCNETQLRADNAINTIEPQLVNPSGSDYRPLSSGNLYSATTYTIPAFSGADREATPLAPEGTLSNSVTRDYAGDSRSSHNPPGAYAGPVRERVPADQYMPWNGFLGMTNILELVNTGTSTLSVTATLFDITGTARGAITVNIPASGQQDLIVNSINGFTADSYGIITLDYSGAALDGRMSFYRQAADGVSYDFAYAIPFSDPLQGNSSVTFNTFQPGQNQAESTAPVYNWLSIINLDPYATRSFTVHRYDAAGTLINSVPTSIAPFGRADLEAGHINPGPSQVGLLRIVPTSPSADYTAMLVRYGAASVDNSVPGYTFAFPLLATGALGTEQYLPVSTGGGAQNWVEAANVSSSTTNIAITMYDGAGNTRLSQSYQLQPHSQVHINATSLLGPNVSGSAKIVSAAADRIISQSMYYFYGSDYGIDAMYGSQSTTAQLAPIAGSYNLFLGMYDWLKLVNTSNSAVSSTIVTYPPNASPRTVSYSLPAHGAKDFGLHEAAVYGTSADSYGQVQVNGNGVTAQVLRIRPDAATGGFDFVFPTIVK